MNKCVLLGRTTKKPDVRYTQGNEPMAVARFNLAVDRKKKDGGADFISIVAFGKTAEFCQKYVDKGQKIAIEGHIQTGSYEKDGHKVYTTDVIADGIEFADSKKPADNPSGEDFMDIPDGLGEELPFV